MEVPKVGDYEVQYEISRYLDSGLKVEAKIKRYVPHNHFPDHVQLQYLTYISKSVSPPNWFERTFTSNKTIEIKTQAAHAYLIKCVGNYIANDKKSEEALANAKRVIYKG